MSVHLYFSVILRCWAKCKGLHFWWRRQEGEDGRGGERSDFGGGGGCHFLGRVRREGGGGKGEGGEGVRVFICFKNV